MRVGFTGTRERITPAQRDSFERHFISFGATHFHHGACVGADAAVAVWVATARMPQPESSGIWPLAVWCKLHAHPSNTPGMTDRVAFELADFRESPMPPLDRNRDIVNATETLIACPKGEEEIRSGTWYTVRYARRLKRKVVVCWPDGHVTEEN
jgi:hypothetical protein